MAPKEISFGTLGPPLVGYGIRGALWYQGEANASGGIEYRTLLPRLIGDWRKRWGRSPLAVGQAVESLAIGARQLAGARPDEIGGMIGGALHRLSAPF